MKVIVVSYCKVLVTHMRSLCPSHCRCEVQDHIRKECRKYSLSFHVYLKLIFWHKEDVVTQLGNIDIWDKCVWFILKNILHDTRQWTLTSQRIIIKTFQRILETKRNVGKFPWIKTLETFHRKCVFKCIYMTGIKCLYIILQYFYSILEFGIFQRKS